MLDLKSPEQDLEHVHAGSCLQAVYKECRERMGDGRDEARVL